MRVAPNGPLPRFAALLALSSLLVASGCSLSRRDSSPSSRSSTPSAPRSNIPSGSAVPSVPPDVLAIPDAVPRVEPRGTRGNPPF